MDMSLSFTEGLGLIGFGLGVINVGWSIGWGVYQYRSQRKGRVSVRVVFNPPMPPDWDRWILQVYVTNTGRIPLYLLGAVVHYNTPGRCSGHLMDEPHGQGNPVAVGDRRYFRLARPDDWPDLAELPRDAVSVTVESHEGVLLTVPGEAITFIGVFTGPEHVTPGVAHEIPPTARGPD